MKQFAGKWTLFFILYCLIRVKNIIEIISVMNIYVRYYQLIKLSNAPFYPITSFKIQYIAILIPFAYCSLNVVILIELHSCTIITFQSSHSTVYATFCALKVCQPLNCVSCSNLRYINLKVIIMQHCDFKRYIFKRYWYRVKVLTSTISFADFFRAR